MSIFLETKEVLEGWKRKNRPFRWKDQARGSKEMVQSEKKDSGK